MSELRKPVTSEETLTGRQTRNISLKKVMMQLQKSNVIPPHVGQSDSFFCKFIYFIPLKLEVKLERELQECQQESLIARESCAGTSAVRSKFN